MKVRILCLVVVSMLLVLTATPALANGRSPEQKAMDAQGLAWRLLISESGTLQSVPPLAREKWQKGKEYVAQGMWPQAQSSFEAASGSLIRQQVEEAWLLKGQPIPDYIFSEASLGVVERGWSLKALAVRVGWAGRLAYQIVGDNGREEDKWRDSEGKIQSWSRRQFTPESRVVVHIDPRFMMRNQYIEAWVVINDGSGRSKIAHRTVVAASTVIFWIPNSDGFKVEVSFVATDVYGKWELPWVLAYLNPIGPGSVVEVTLP